MHTLLVRFDLPDDAAAAAFDALVADAVPLIRQREAGTLTYLPYGVEGRPLVRFFYEVYRDAEAHAEHRRQPHTVEFLTAVRQLASDITIDQLIPLPPDVEQP